MFYLISGKSLTIIPLDQNAEEIYKTISILVFIGLNLTIT